MALEEENGEETVAGQELENGADLVAGEDLENGAEEAGTGAGVEVAGAVAVVTGEETISTTRSTTLSTTATAISPTTIVTKHMTIITNLNIEDVSLILYHVINKCFTSIHQRRLSFVDMQEFGTIQYYDMINTLLVSKKRK